MRLLNTRTRVEYKTIQDGALEDDGLSIIKTCRACCRCVWTSVCGQVCVDKCVSLSLSPGFRANEPCRAYMFSQ